MKKNRKTYGFSAINIKSRVAKRFRSFSKKTAKSHTGTLIAVMDFFEWHGFVPSDRLGQSFLQEIINNRKLTETSIKRTEASIAIIRDIEITQTKPTNAILEALLEQKVKHERPKVEPKPLRQEPLIETTVPKIRYERLMDKMEMLKRESQYVVGNTTLVKPSFGKPYLRLDITAGELENYKRTLQNL
ncbi:BfmA/BtgA family mobilization protein [Flagellimonas onchidii]|uniref:BfmA/BtgA family mobilization protein n=1 Tax=Flagellimonas onchidii TaxID=2562684 RepID=UPI0010A644B3|nr:BfmA/BtgA family mobilization protein [Allomuricauda onchidii]